MSVFLDTSAFVAVLNDNDPNHDRARAAWLALVDSPDEMFCTNHVIVETMALLQHRHGMAAVRAYLDEVVPALSVIYIDEEHHTASVRALLIAGRRQLSLVDCTSFDTMRRLGIRQAFTFDEHFAEQGFDCIPRL